MFKSKLQEIIKSERKSLFIFIAILVMLMPFIIWFIVEEYNPTKFANLLCIFAVYFLLLMVVYKKNRIIKDLKWSVENYNEEPQRVENILKVRKASLISYHGEISLYYLYDEALKLYQLQVANCG